VTQFKDELAIEMVPFQAMSYIPEQDSRRTLTTCSYENQSGIGAPVLRRRRSSVPEMSAVTVPTPDRARTRRARTFTARTTRRSS
jgi:hypothetical protein